MHLAGYLLHSNKEVSCSSLIGCEVLRGEARHTRSSPMGPAEQDDGGSLSRTVQVSGQRSHTGRAAPLVADEAIDDGAGTPPGREVPHHEGEREAVKERERETEEGSTHRPRSVSSLLIRFNAMSGACVVCE